MAGPKESLPIGSLRYQFVYLKNCMYLNVLTVHTYIYIPSGPQVSARGGVEWGMLTSYSWYVDGWGGVGHVNVMFMVRGNFEKEHVAACCSRVLTLKQQRAKKW